MENIIESDLVPAFREHLAAAGLEPLAGRVQDADFPYLVNQFLEATGAGGSVFPPLECHLSDQVARYLEYRTGWLPADRNEADLPDLLRQAILLDTGEDPGSLPESWLPGLWCAWVEGAVSALYFDPDLNVYVNPEETPYVTPGDGLYEVP